MVYLKMGTDSNPRPSAGEFFWENIKIPLDIYPKRIYNTIKPRG